MNDSSAPTASAMPPMMASRPTGGTSANWSPIPWTASASMGSIAAATIPRLAAISSGLAQSTSSGALAPSGSAVSKAFRSLSQSWTPGMETFFHFDI